MACVELAPGIVLETGDKPTVYLCPGCGLEAMGMEASEENVLDWLVGAFTALNPEGGIENHWRAQRFAEKYLGGDFHDERG